MARSASRPIAKRWIYHYWHLLEDDSNSIPQIRGESSGARLQIGFRPQLKRLIEASRHSGGLDGFAVALRNDSFDAGQREIFKAIFSKLIPVIVVGPVTHAGGSLETGRLLSYDGRSRRIVVSGEIWRELCLSGNPDIVLPKYRKIIYVYGLFWHGHKRCRRDSIPATNSAF